MSKPKRPWNGFARYMVYNYPTLCREEKHLHDTTITPAYGGTPGGGGRTDKTADAALRELPEVKRRQLEAVRQAVATVRATHNGDKKLKIIDLYYWKKSHKLYGAALAVDVCTQTAVKWNTEFLDIVAKNYGLI